MYYKYGRSTELQKSANETLYPFSQISLTLFLEAKCPIYSTHVLYILPIFSVSYIF